MNQKTKQDQLDFDNWMNLAENDPELFESLRLSAIDEVIESAPEDRQIHLRRLQWRIDMARERAGTPMAATLAISRMMWDAFHTLKQQYDEFFADGQIAQPVRRAPKSAQILVFRPQMAEA